MNITKTQDNEVQKIVAKKLKRQRHWIWVWVIIWIFLISAISYFAYSFSNYAKQKTTKLIEEGQMSEQIFDYSLALEKYDTALALQVAAKKNAAQAAYLAGNIYLKKNNPLKAQEYYRRAAHLDQDPIYFSSFFSSLISTRSIEEADQLIEERKNDNSPELLAAKVRLALAEQNVEKAKQLLSELDESKFNLDLALLKTVLISSENYEQSQTELNKHLESADSEQKKEISALLQVLKDIKDTNDTAYNCVLLGHGLLEFAEYDLALAEFNTALQSDETYRDAWMYKAYAEYLIDKNSEAKNSIQKALDLDPTFGFSVFLQGLITEKENNSKEAQKYFEQALSLKYQDPQVYLALADLLISQNQIDQALTYLEQGLESNSQVEKFFTELIWINIIEKEDFAAAKNWVDKYQQALPLGAQAEELQILVSVLNKENQAGEKADQTLKEQPQSAIVNLASGINQGDKERIKRAVDLDFEGKVAKLAEKYL